MTSITIPITIPYDLLFYALFPMLKVKDALQFTDASCLQNIYDTSNNNNNTKQQRPQMTSITIPLTIPYDLLLYALFPMLKIKDALQFVDASCLHSRKQPHCSTLQRNTTTTTSTHTIDTISHDVLLYVLLPMLNVTDAIQFILSSQYYYKYLYCKYDIRQEFRWNDTLKQCLALMQNHYHSLPLIRTIMCTVEDLSEQTEPFLSTIEQITITSSYISDTRIRLKAYTLPKQLKSLRIDTKVGFGPGIFLLEEILLDVKAQVAAGATLPSNLEELQLDDCSSNEITYDNFHNIMTPNLKKLFFPYTFDLQLLPGMLPNTLEYLDMGGCCTNTTLSKGILPDSLITLVLGNLFNAPLTVGLLPNSLKHLKFDHLFNQPIQPNVLPNTLETLVFGEHFNQPLLPNVLPASLQSLVFDDNFNQPFERDVLPSKLTQLIISCSNYTHAFGVGVLPHSLPRLCLRYKGPALLPGVLPSSLETLVLTEYAHELAVNVLPSNLKHLKLISSGCKISKVSFPNSLRSLEVYNCNIFIARGVLPSNLESFMHTNNQTYMGFDFNKGYLETIAGFTIGSFPSGIKKITLCNINPQSLQPGVFLEGLEILEFGERFDECISRCILPSTLKILRFGRCFNQRLSRGVLPEGLEELELGDNYNAKIDAGALPSTLQRIKLPKRYRFDVRVLLPVNCYAEYIMLTM